MESFLKTGKLGKEDVSAKAGMSKMKPKKESKLTPWVEKYRPRSMDEVVEQHEIVAVLKQCLTGADLPHFLFYGPPGTGKTSTIIAAARQLFGDIYKERILELNASDDRGIQVIREKVKNFSQLTASSVRPDGRPCPPYKIVILDEADSMTSAAQAALRRTMEKETRSTRFCLICNYVSCIIQPLTSRCTKFRFKPLGQEKMLDKLKEICDAEDVKCEPEAMKLLVEMSGGDMRRAITCLQSCSRLKAGDQISTSDVFEVTGIVPNHWIKGLMEVCEIKDYQKLEDYIDKMMMEAYSASQILDQVQKSVIDSLELTDVQKANICEKIAVCSWRLQDGASEFLQLMDLCYTIVKAHKSVTV
ncbi:replication factor C subunit 4 [Homalodisca vitripennis]|nr:replication factor C subunit 4 [Homalodisca vitripennis]KAG8267894.1 replication factor C subunit 4 [Homalodisca vitripennis]